MRNRRLLMLLTALLVIASLLAGCAGSRPAGSKENAGKETASSGGQAETGAGAGSKQTTYPVTVQDDAGRSVTIAAEPKRIVSVAPSNTELVFALGKGGSLVGRSDFDDYPPEVQQIESIGGFYPPNYEKIVSLKPDLVLLIGGSEEAREKLTNEYKLTTFVVQPENFAQLYESIRKLGLILNAQEPAERLVAEMEQQVNAIREKAARATTRPVVFYEVWHDPLQTAGPNTFIHDMITLAGGVNAAASAKEPWPQFSLEQLVAADPEIIITGSEETAKAVPTRPGWQSIKAVKNGKVFGVPDQNLIVRPGPRLVQGLKWMAEQIHPEIFKQ